VLPVRRLRVRNLTVLAEHYDGTFTPIASCKDEDVRNWLVDSVGGWRNLDTLEWEESTPLPNEATTRGPVEGTAAKTVAAKVDWFYNDLAYTAPELYDMKFARFKEDLVNLVSELITNGQ
jgi:hypothetical protein